MAATGQLVLGYAPLRFALPRPPVRSTGRHTAWGELPDGREVVIVFEIESDDLLIIQPITAYGPGD